MIATLASTASSPATSPYTVMAFNSLTPKSDQSVIPPEINTTYSIKHRGHAKKRNHRKESCKGQRS